MKKNKGIVSQIKEKPAVYSGSEITLEDIRELKRQLSEARL